MAKRLLLRDAENISADQAQRILGSLLWNAPVVGGVGTGFSAGIVGKTPSPTTGHCAVTANGTTMVLTILPGWAHILRDAGASTYDPRILFAESDANDSVTVSANATGSTRNDTVCLKVDMATAPTSDGSNLVTFVIIAGQSGGAVSNAPADGNFYLPLANIAVANGATSISAGNVTDLRSSALALGGVPAGRLGYAEVIVDQTSIGNTPVDLTGLSVTVNVTTGRRIKISAYVAFQSTVANDYVNLHIVELGADICSPIWSMGIANTQIQGYGMVVLLPSAGTHTYKLQGSRIVGTGTVTLKATANNRAFILVEDAGV